MRLVQIMLDAFGFFTNQHFDLGKKESNKSDFHIFYGPNEAGKTTLMKAWQQFLFGFSTKENYAFFQDRRNLKVSATLEEGGEHYHFIRYPKGKTKSVLVDENGNNRENDLQNWLHGLDKTQYQNLLCLDDVTIEEGGELILKNEGQMGELLFSSAAGLNNFSRQLDTLKDEAEQLYKKKAKKTEFATLKRKYDELSEKIRASKITATQYQELKQKAQTYLDDEQRLEQEVQSLSKKCTALQFIQNKITTFKEQKQIYSNAIENLRNTAEKIGIELPKITEDNLDSLFQYFSHLRLTEKEKQQFDEIKTNFHTVESEKRKREEHLATLREKYNTEKQRFESSKNKLPNVDLQNTFLRLADTIDFDSLNKQYATAKQLIEEKNKQLSAALIDLTIKGQSFIGQDQTIGFKDIPLSSLTAQEADEIYRKIQQIENEITYEEKNKDKLIGELNFYDNELAARHRQTEKRI